MSRKDLFKCVPYNDYYVNFLLPLIGLIFALNVYSVPGSYRLQVVLTIAKVLGLTMIILMGFVRLAQGTFVNREFDCKYLQKLSWHVYY